MKPVIDIFFRKTLTFLLLSEMFLSFDTLCAATFITPAGQIDSIDYVQYKGLIVDHKSGSPLAFASILLKGTNISTVSNTEGAFSLKVPKNYLNGSILISFLGYRNMVLSISDVKTESNRFELEALTVDLPEISVIFNDAASLMLAVIDKKGDNYSANPAIMTAFYRETIKKRKTYVSLQEAVVDIYKYAYTSGKDDWASLYKVRKNTDYEKLDTLVFKLMGGPYNTLAADVMKNSDIFFTEKMLTNYEFAFEKYTRIDNRTVYVIDFKQRPTYTDPLFYGKLYIDAQSLAMISAEYNLNLKNREAATQLFIKKKPLNAKVYPTRFHCRVDYVQKENKWYLNYCRVELDVYIDWKRRLFNTLYESTMEMAVTDWTTSNVEEKWLRPRERMKKSVIVADEAAGFADPLFWGELNVIEPEKSIESAIRKIQKQLKKK